MTETVVRGKAWVGKDNIFAFDIIPQARWTLDNLNPDDLGRWALEGADSEFKDKENAFKNEGYTFVVAGKNFGGGGKSIEHPIFALKGAGVKAVLADSFARYFFRNSVNNGLPVFVCEGISHWVKKGDELCVNFVKGQVTNIRTGVQKDLVPLTDFVMDIMEAGGLLEYTKSKLQAESFSSKEGDNE